jgi:hypothetical protein
MKKRILNALLWSLPIVALFVYDLSVHQGGGGFIPFDLSPLFIGAFGIIAWAAFIFLNVFFQTGKLAKFFSLVFLLGLYVFMSPAAGRLVWFWEQHWFWEPHIRSRVGNVSLEEMVYFKKIEEGKLKGFDFAITLDIEKGGYFDIGAGEFSLENCGEKIKQIPVDIDRLEYSVLYSGYLPEGRHTFSSNEVASNNLKNYFFAWIPFEKNIENSSNIQDPDASLEERVECKDLSLEIAVIGRDFFGDYEYRFVPSEDEYVEFRKTREVFWHRSGYFKDPYFAESYTKKLIPRFKDDFLEIQLALLDGTPISSVDQCKEEIQKESISNSDFRDAKKYNLEACEEVFSRKYYMRSFE